MLKCYLLIKDSTLVIIVLYVINKIEFLNELIEGGYNF